MDWHCSWGSATASYRHAVLTKLCRYHILLPNRQVFGVVLSAMITQGATQSDRQAVKQTSVALRALTVEALR